MVVSEPGDPPAASHRESVFASGKVEDIVGARRLRLEDERLRLAPEVIGGNPEAVEKDKRLEERIREIAGEGETHPDRATEPNSKDGTA